MSDYVWRCRECDRRTEKYPGVPCKGCGTNRRPCMHYLRVTRRRDHSKSDPPSDRGGRG